MADLAFLLLVFVAVGGIFSAARGVAVDLDGVGRQADLPRAGTPAVWVRVRADDSVLVDGSPVPRALAAEAVRGRLSPYTEAVVVLHAEPRATFGALAFLLSEIVSGDPGFETLERRIAIPTRAQLEAHLHATGRDPFEEIR
jgi:biopolymer transport protein ExbD